MTFEINDSVLLYGKRSSSFGVGASVARASAAMVSITRLIQSTCTGERGDSSRNTALTKDTTHATKDTVSWNCRNFRMES